MNRISPGLAAFCAVQRHCQLPRSDGGDGKIFQARGGEIIYNAEVSALSEHKNGVVIRTRQGGEYEASTLISCSGLMADRLVKCSASNRALLSARSAASISALRQSITRLLTT